MTITAEDIRREVKEIKYICSPLFIFCKESHRDNGNDNYEK